MVWVGGSKHDFSRIPLHKKHYVGPTDPKLHWSSRVASLNWGKQRFPHWRLTRQAACASLRDVLIVVSLFVPFSHRRVLPTLLREDITKRERTAKRHAATTQSFLNYKFIVTILALDTNTYTKFTQTGYTQNQFLVD